MKQMSGGGKRRPSGVKIAQNGTETGAQFLQVFTLSPSIWTNAERVWCSLKCMV